jgi:hypothetical protein
VARRAVAEIVEEMSEFFSEHGHCPQSGETLVTAHPRRDPWGSLIEVTCTEMPAGGITARSLGPDGISGTPDDLESSWFFGQEMPRGWERP